MQVRLPKNPFAYFTMKHVNYTTLISEVLDLVLKHPQKSAFILKHEFVNTQIPRRINSTIIFTSEE